MTLRTRSFTRCLAACRALTLSVATIAVTGFMIPTHAAAAERVWTGGASTGQWSNPANWDGGVVPVDGDSVVLPAVGPAAALENDLVGLDLVSLTIQRSDLLSGNAIRLGAGGLQLGAGFFTTVTMPISLDVNQTWSVGAGATLNVAGNVDLVDKTLTLDGDGRMQILPTMAMSGTGALVKNGAGRTEIEAANTYSGLTTVNAGILILRSALALGAGDGTPATGTVVNAGGSLWAGVSLANEHLTISGLGSDGRGALRGFEAQPTFSGPVVLAADAGIAGGLLRLNGPISGPGKLMFGDGVRAEVANSANSFTGGVQLGAFGTSGVVVTVTANEALPGTPALAVPAESELAIPVGVTQSVVGPTGAGRIMIDGTLIASTSNAGSDLFSGQIWGVGQLRHVGFGRLDLSGLNPLTGTLRIDAGLVRVTGDTRFATVNVTAAPSSLDHRGFSVVSPGRVGAVTVESGATMWLTTSGATSGRAVSLTVRNGGRVLAGDGTSPMMGSVTVEGAVVIEPDAEFSTNTGAGFAPPLGGKSTVIDNEGDDAIAGVFSMWPEGQAAGSLGDSYRATYVGGTGNDFVLTKTADSLEYRFSEGAAGSFFTTEILIANPNDKEVIVETFFTDVAGNSMGRSDTLAPYSHATVRANDVVQNFAAEFSTTVRSLNRLPLIVERTMSWDTNGYGAHTEHALEDPSATWYFAEGSQGFFSTYLLLANPQSTSSVASVQYLREGEPAIVREYPLVPRGRVTVDAGADPELVGRSFGMVVTFSLPGFAERSMYFGATPLWNGGHESAGVPKPSTTWFLAEGATGPFFESFVLLANPHDSETSVTLTYLPSTGVPVMATKTLAPRGRATVNLEIEDPSLANAAVSTKIEATQPIVVERSQYWPDPAPAWHEAHNSFGLTDLDTKWGLAEGRIGGPRNAQTYILLANPGTTAANVTIQFLRESQAPLTKTFSVQPTSRFNVAVGPGTEVPELTNENFGVVITSDQPIAVERALYWDANSQIWAAGTNANATRLK